MAVHALSMTRAGAHLPQSRQFIEDEIERLISLLDALDGDCDNEPILGWVTSPIYGVCTPGGDCDREWDDDLELDSRELPKSLPTARKGAMGWGGNHE